jgi:hypothetical protein
MAFVGGGRYLIGGCDKRDFWRGIGPTVRGPPRKEIVSADVTRITADSPGKRLALGRANGTHRDRHGWRLEHGIGRYKRIRFPKPRGGSFRIRGFRIVSLASVQTAASLLAPSRCRIALRRRGPSVSGMPTLGRRSKTLLTTPKCWHLLSARPDPTSRRPFPGLFGSGRRVTGTKSDVWSLAVERHRLPSPRTALALASALR